MTEPDFRPAGWSSDPDVRSVGWVTEQPGATLRRTRSWGWLVIGGLLLAGGVGALIGGILSLVADTGPDEAEVVADGVVAALDGPDAVAATFTAGGSVPFTVWLSTDRLDNSVFRENVEAATRCVADLADGEQATFQGNRQGAAVEVDDWATVGWFTAAEGGVTVTCRQVEFGRRGNYDRLRDEHEFIVEAGKPSFPLAGVLVLSGGVVAGLLGVAALTKGVRGRLRAVR